MTANRALVRFPSAGGFDEDIVVNTWAFDLTTQTPAIADAVRDNLQVFYNAFGLGLTSTVSWTLGEIRWYRMADAKPRTPWYINNLPVSTQVSSSKTAREVALAVSFQGLPLSGIPQARRRGRVYIGPLSTGAIDSTTGLMLGTLCSTAAAAAESLLDNSLGSPDWTWGVISSYSPQILVPVNDGWVDNAVDIQRRRGQKATSTVLFGDPPPSRVFGSRARAVHVNELAGGQLEAPQQSNEA